jgi:hypothetical protein
MIRELLFRVVHAGKFPQHLDEVGLALGLESRRHYERIFQCRKSQMLLIQNLLRPDEFLVKLR